MMEMDEDAEDFVEEDDFVEVAEIDWEYEFDAVQYFDFSRLETQADSQEAERWFSNAGNYPASQALIVKLKWGGGTQDGSISTPSKGTGGVKETKTKPALRSSKHWSSTLMKPTVSRLAKLQKGGDIVLPQPMRGSFRSQKSPTHMDEKRNLQNFIDSLATKRQKLETGYLLKGSRLRHQALLLHKKSLIKDGNTTPNAAYTKRKVTIPKEPALETLQRAMNRRSRSNSESSERSELETQISLAPRTGRKILKPPSPTPSMKSKQKLTEFQVFNFKTTARALQRSNSELSRHSSDNPDDLKRSSINDALKKEKNERPLKAKAGTYSNKIYPAKEDTCSGVKSTNKETTVEECKLEKEEKLSQNPPTELFKKLSLKSDMGTDTVQPKSGLSATAKVLKENTPDSFQPDFWRCVGKMNQCGSVKAIPGIAYQPNANRKMGIYPLK